MALSDLSGRTSSSISRWEAGEQLPEVDALTAIAEGLNLPVSFFLKENSAHGEAPMFARSMAAATKSVRARVQTRLRWAQDISLALQDSLELPEVNVPHLQASDFREIRDEDIERIAGECRESWQLGIGPVSDLLLAMENAGIVIVKEHVGAATMDGLSNWSEADSRPYVFLAADKATCVRSRLDAAHELGHLVLHRHLGDRDLYDTSAFKEIERQAFYFAGAFLLPDESFSAEVWSPSLAGFASLKERWKVSIAAMIMRCHNLGIVSDSMKQRLFKNYSSKGWRKHEPLDGELAIETPRLLARSIGMICDAKIYQAAELPDVFRLPANDIESLCGLPTGFLSANNTISDLRVRNVAEGDSGNVIPFPGRR